MDRRTEVVARLRAAVAAALAAVVLAAGCAGLKRMAINQVGDTLAEGNSVFESDDDVDLVGEALPFGLKLMESLLSQSPNHKGMLLTACKGFTSYSYAYVHFDAEVTREVDLDAGKEKAARARRLYERARRYGLRGLEVDHGDLEERLADDPPAALAGMKAGDVPLLYWSAAALGLAISVSRGDARMLVRLPEVEAMLDRALALDESWGEGSLHEFAIVLAGAAPGFSSGRVPDLRRHYERALDLSGGGRASLFVAWAESVSVPMQNAVEFREMLDRALAVDPDAREEIRLMNLVSRRRAAWMLSRIDDLFLDPGGTGTVAEEGRR
jgi:hypothetical protein